MPASITISRNPVLFMESILRTVNYCKNPSFEVNVTDDWTTTGAPVRDTTKYVVGTASCDLIAGAVNTRMTSNAGVVVPTGVMVTASVRIWCGADPAGNKARLVLVDGGASVATAYATISGAFETVTVSYLNAGAPATIQFRVANFFNDSATHIWFDACQLELTSGPSAYCDGSLGTGYSWDGVANNSVSRLITPGGMGNYTRNLRPAAGPSNALAEAGTYSNYSHKIRGLGGFWQCSFVWHDELSVLMCMLAEGWVRDIRVMGERGMEVWEGFVAGMELSLTGGMPALKVTGYGYYRTLFWRVYNEIGFGHVDAIISAEVATIVTAAGPFIASQALDVNASLVDRYHDADRFAGDILFDMCAAGNSQNHRFLIGCYEDRQLRFREIALYETRVS